MATTNGKDRLDGELARARRGGKPLLFALIDIDHFKRVNDTYGHPAGDTVIRNLARLLRQRLRRGDTIGRYGGEEFAIILPDTPLDEGRRLLDRLRSDFAASEQSYGGASFRVSFSGGLAEATEITAVEGLVVAADTALYDAKRNGRNRISLAETGRVIRRVGSKRGA